VHWLDSAQDTPLAATVSETQRYVWSHRDSEATDQHGTQGAVAIPALRWRLGVELRNVRSLRSNPLPTLTADFFRTVAATRRGTAIHCQWAS
jgi:hypothetical protein